MVTTKLGSSDKRPGTQQPLVRTCRFYAGEMMMSTFVLTSAFYGVFSVNKWSFSIFLTLQGTSLILIRQGCSAFCCMLRGLVEHARYDCDAAASNQVFGIC